MAADKLLGQLERVNPTDPGRYVVSDDDRRLVAFRFRPEGMIRRTLPAMTRCGRLALFDQAYALAENVAHLPGGLTDGRKLIRDDLFGFAWRLNDIVVDLHSRLRNRISGRVPPSAYELARARRRHRVPVAVGGVHVFLALRAGYRAAAPGACVVFEPRPDFETFDLRFVAGLNVEILATSCDTWFGDAVARILAADGASHIAMRRLDSAPRPPETLFNGGQRWGV